MMLAWVGETRWRRVRQGAGLLLALALPVTAGAVSLSEAYKLALENDAKFRSAQSEARASGTAIDQARAGFLPTIRFDLERTETRNNVLRNENAFVGVGARTYQTDSHTLSITQPVFRADVIARFAQSQAVVRQGAALMVEQRELSGDRLASEVLALTGDAERRRRMSEAARALARPDAAKAIVDKVLALAR